MSKSKRDVYTQKAESLLSADKSDAIKIDWLAFAIPISALRHCRKAGNVNLTMDLVTGFKKSFFTGEKIPQVKRIKRTGIYPNPPKIKSSQLLGVDDYEKHKDESAALMREFYEETLKIWVNEVLGFEMSPMRGRGLHGYKDSMTLRCNGSDVGFIGIGGQGDTIYFQITGSGCKSLFSRITPFVMHHWLSKVFMITRLGRIDLAFDDFDNNFNCDYAHAAYKDDWFRTSNRGKSPALGLKHVFTYDKNMNPVFETEMITVGSRKSDIYWRVYNKKLEQGIEQDDFTWYRSEAELKRWSVDCLLNLAATFAGLCPFSASVDLDKGVRTKAMSKPKEVCLDIAARVKHVRRSAGKALGDILELFDGDIEHTMGLILPHDTGGKLGLPPTYKHLINEAIRV